MRRFLVGIGLLVLCLFTMAPSTITPPPGGTTSISLIRSNSVVDMTAQTGQGGDGALPATPQYAGQLGVSYFGPAFYLWMATGTSPSNWTAKFQGDFMTPCNFGTSAGYYTSAPQWTFDVNRANGNQTNLDLANDSDGNIMCHNWNLFKYAQVGVMGVKTNGAGVYSPDTGNWYAFGCGNPRVDLYDEGLAGVGFIVTADAQHPFTICSTGDTLGSTNGAKQRMVFDPANNRFLFPLAQVNIATYTNPAAKMALEINNAQATVRCLSNIYSSTLWGTNAFVAGKIVANAYSPQAPTAGLQVAGMVSYTNLVIDCTGDGGGVFGALVLDGGNAAAFRTGLIKAGANFTKLAHASGAPMIIARSNKSDLLDRTETLTDEVTVDSSGNVQMAGSLAVGGGGAILKTLVGSATLDFASTSAQNSRDLTITVTGAAIGDTVSLGVNNAAVTANTCFTAFVSAANTVTVRFNNYSSAASDPASSTFKVIVMQQ